MCVRACVCVGAGGAGGSNAKITSLDLPNYGQVYVCQFNIIENIKYLFRKIIMMMIWRRWW